MSRLVKPDYVVVRDTREKAGMGWKFSEDPSTKKGVKCIGMVIETLKDGDYTLVGYEDLVAIERKFGYAELWGNYIGERKEFEKKMERLGALKYPFLLIEGQLTPDILALSPPQVKI